MSEYLVERLTASGRSVRCDFPRARAIDPSESVAVGLPDTIWFPADALRTLPDDTLAFLTFPVDHPELFDSVITDGSGRVKHIQVKSPNAFSNLIWGAFRMPDGRRLLNRNTRVQDA